MSQFRNWQFTKGAVEAPQEYLDYVLCAHIYHCTPDELDAQPAVTTSIHLDFYGEEMEKKSGKRRVFKGKRKRLG